MTHLQFLAGVLAALALAGLLGQKVWNVLINCDPAGNQVRKLTLVNVGQNTTLCNGDVSQKLVQLLIVANGELEMTGNDTGLLVITSSVASKFENFGGEILENGSEVDGSTSTDALSIVALAEKTVNTANGESQTSLGGTAKTQPVSGNQR